MNEVEDDFGEAIEGSAPPASLKAIAELAKRQLALEKEIEARTAALKTVQEELRGVQETLLPNAMNEVGLSSFTLESGEMVEIKKDIYCSVPKERFDELEVWLRSRELDGVIKHQLTMLFGKGEDEDAQRAAAVLLDNGFMPTDTKTVHPQTLKALIKEQLALGVDVPLSTCGAYESVKSKITLPKRR